MVWQYGFEKEFIKNIQFKDIQPDEDVIFIKEVLKKLGTTEVLTLDKPFYFYNFLREGSNTYNFMNQSLEGTDEETVMQARQDIVNYWLNKIEV